MNLRRRRLVLGCLYAFAIVVNLLILLLLPLHWWRILNAFTAVVLAGLWSRTDTMMRGFIADQDRDV